MLRGFLMSMAVTHNREVTPELFEAWLSLTAGIPDETLLYALRRVAESAVCFPAPGHVLAEVENVSKTLADSEALAAWAAAYRYAIDNGCLPAGSKNIIGSLDERTRRALEAAGGANRLASCPEAEIQWIRKTFLEAWRTYRRREALDSQRESLPDSLRESLAALAERKTLPQ